MAVKQALDVDSVLIAHGFGREFQEKLHCPIPEEVLCICALFCGSVYNEYFAEYGSSYAVDAEGCSITTSNYGGFHSAFGNVLINSNRHKIHSWTFVISKRKTYMKFGITETSENNVHRDFAQNARTYNYCASRNMHGHGRLLKCNNAQGTYHGFKLKDGTLLTMELNTQSKALTFYIDSHCLGAAFTDIKCEEGIYYKMAISLYDINNFAVVSDEPDDNPADNTSGSVSVKLLEYTQSEIEHRNGSLEITD